MIYFVILIIFILSPFLLKYLLLKKNPKGQRIYTDESEITILIEDTSINLPYDKIKKIVFTEEKRRRFYIWPRIEVVIKIFPRERPNPFVFTKSSGKKFFEEYKKILKDFARSNRVNLINELEDKRNKK